MYEENIDLLLKLYKGKLEENILSVKFFFSKETYIEKACCVQFSGMLYPT